MPVYNDWQAASRLCRNLGREFQRKSPHSITILMADDGSSVNLDPQLVLDNCSETQCPIQVLRLRRNLGHQRAIAVALTYIYENIACDAVVVMDADGEDRAEDVPRLIAALEKQDSQLIVFAERGRRVEGLLFKLGYLFYKVLHYFATGTGIRVGNFSIIPFKHLNSLVVLTELWNHYAAAVFKSRIPYSAIRADRGERLHGRSKMNFVSLVIHGLSALFSYHELVGTRIFVGLVGFASLLLVIIAILSGAHFVYGWNLPGTLTPLVITLVVLAGQALVMSFGMVFFIMMSRSSQGFLPIRDYKYFVQSHFQVMPDSLIGDKASWHRITA